MGEKAGRLEMPSGIKTSYIFIVDLWNGDISPHFQNQTKKKPNQNRQTKTHHEIKLTKPDRPQMVNGSERSWCNPCHKWSEGSMAPKRCRRVSAGRCWLGKDRPRSTTSFLSHILYHPRHKERAPKMVSWKYFLAVSD